LGPINKCEGAQECEPMIGHWINSLLTKTTAMLAALPICFASQAGAQQLTHYAHYLVDGDTAQRLLQSMLTNGPKVGGSKAYATARMDPVINASAEVIGHQCRIARFKMNMKFTIHLPQLENNRAFEPSLRRSFERFYAFAKHHEETHRAIWLQCAAEAETLATGVMGATCAEAEALSLKIVREVSKRCDKRHAAFDANEQKRLFQHPFMLQARFRLPADRQENTVSSATLTALQ
jgi:predicted secreted Zn-dependent protease